MKCELCLRPLGPRITFVRGCSHRFHVDCMYDWLEFAYSEEILFVCPGQDCFAYSPIIEVGLCDENGNMFNPTKAYDAYSFLRQFKGENLACQRSPKVSGDNMEADISTRMSSLNLSSPANQNDSRPLELQGTLSTAMKEAEC
ncbi:unnamed protein product [Rodentolepis nana]|uniref:RING-type domain-containing protein n=1 Tax=Rodentolepis nana TaxID=102285 RepID=A0A0R3TJE9_RODNA|nr:unnamed protein product [Rodentolepis nana]